MIAPEAIAQLSLALSRLRDGETSAEIVRWLRAMAPQLATRAEREPVGGGRGYSRHLLYKDVAFEILAMRWNAGCVTPIHDHGGSRCWFAVAQGSVGVENFRRHDGASIAGRARITPDGREDLAAGGVDYRSDDVHLHRCLSRDAGALTLHVYAAPLQTYLEFDERAQTCAPAMATYDSVAGGQESGIAEAPGARRSG